MSIFWQSLALFITGFLDSIHLKRVAAYFLASRKIRNSFIYCFLLNAVLFGGLVLLHGYLKSFLKFLTISNTVQGFFDLLYYFVLLMTYLISFILSSFMITDIAEDAILIEKRIFENENFYSRAVDAVTRIRNEIYRSLLVLFFFIQLFLLSLIPYVGLPMKLLHLSFLYSLYCFEYKWGTDSNLMKNLSFFESHYAYFTGFGFIFAMLVSFIPTLLSIGFYAALFPIFLCTAIRATPPDVKGITDKAAFFRYFGKREKTHLLIKNFKYDDAEDGKKVGIFYFCRKGIKFVEKMMEKYFGDKVT